MNQLILIGLLVINLWITHAFSMDKIFAVGFQQSYVTNSISYPLVIHQSFLKFGVGQSWGQFGVEFGQSNPWRESQGNLSSESSLRRFGFWTAFRALQWESLDLAWELGSFFSEVRFVQKFGSVQQEGTSGFMSYLRTGPTLNWRFSQPFGANFSYQLENTPLWGNLLNQSLLASLFFHF